MFYQFKVYKNIYLIRRWTNILHSNVQHWTRSSITTWFYLLIASPILFALLFTELSTSRVITAMCNYVSMFQSVLSNDVTTYNYLQVTPTLLSFIFVMDIRTFCVSCFCHTFPQNFVVANIPEVTQVNHPKHLHELSKWSRWFAIICSDQLFNYDVPNNVY